MIRHLLFLLIAMILLTASCTSIPQNIDPQWTEEMFFKNAQVAMDENRYKTAMFYYEVFLVRYPERLQKVIAAEYERAFIQYKMGDYDDAARGFYDIIERYEEGPYATIYQPRFLELSRIGLTNIEKRRAVDGRLLWRVREKQWAEDHGESLIDVPEEG